MSKFGISQNEFLDLEINISEKKTKMVIKTNQVSTRIDYEIAISYILSNQSKKCIILTKKQYSRFSFIPKSEGYNFGSDKFLDNLYIRNIENNIDQFLDSLEKQMINLKNKHGVPITKNIETTTPEEDKIRDLNDPEEKGPLIN